MYIQWTWRRRAFSQLGYPVVKAEQHKVEQCEAKQREVLREFAKGQNGFVSIPTGSEKSLCYGCLPLVLTSCVLEEARLLSW